MVHTQTVCAQSLLEQHTNIHTFHKQEATNRRWWVYIYRLFHQTQVNCLDTNCLDYAAPALTLQKRDGHIMVIACKQLVEPNHICCLCPDWNLDKTHGVSGVVRAHGNNTVQHRFQQVHLKRPNLAKTEIITKLHPLYVKTLRTAWEPQFRFHTMA